MSKNLVLHPVWKEALLLFDNSTFSYGDIVPFSWFYKAFGLEVPSAHTFLKEGKNIQLKFLSAFKKLEETLLKERYIALASIRGEGYKIVHPKEQTQWAEQEGLSIIHKAIEQMQDRETYINHSLLTIEERRENMDAIARTSMLRHMVIETERKALFSPTSSIGISEL